MSGTSARIEWRSYAKEVRDLRETDPEAAHVLEDRLTLRVLQHVADGRFPVTSQVLAKWTVELLEEPARR